MKYSLKNKQFRKRNNIFGDRKKGQDHFQQLSNDLDEIRQIGEQSEDSRMMMDYLRDGKNDNIYRFINLQATATEPRKQSLKKQQRKGSVQRLPSRHGLPPNSKPLLNNSNIGLSQSKYGLKRFKMLQLRSSVININYLPEKKQEILEEIMSVIQKIYAVVLKNNDRIDQLQSLILSLVENSRFIMKQTCQGISKAFKLQQRTTLFINTMLSVYQNLRICRLKQDNIQLYVKQKDQQKISIEVTNETDQKMGKSKYSLADMKKQICVSVQDKQSKELISLVDYQSDYSLSDSVLMSQRQNLFHRPTYTKISVTDKNISEYQYSEYKFDEKSSFKDRSNLNLISSPKQFNQQEKLSPFQTNKIMYYPSSFTHKSAIQVKLNDAKISKNKAQEFQTFRVNKNNKYQNSLQYQKVKSWLQKNKYKGLKCWLDDMGCLRRPNMTYIFYENGQVISMQAKSFRDLVEEGELISVFNSF